MPLRKMKVAKQRPNAEMQLLVQWWAGEATPEEAAEAKADMHFTSRELMCQVWAEVREQILPLYRRNPERFITQMDRLWVHRVLSVNEVKLLFGAEDAAAYAEFSFRDLPN